MAAISKNELLELIEKEYGKLETLVNEIDKNLAILKDKDDVSIKDVIGHRFHWIDLFFGWYNDGRAGKEVSFPAPGYKWNQLKAYNANLRTKQKDLGWDDVCKMLAKRHNKLLDLIKQLSNKQLYGGPMKGANNSWTTGRWAEAAGPSHYRSAAKYIRAARKKA